MNWNTNSPVTHPPCQVPCMIRTRDGQEHEAMLIHLNPRYCRKAKNLDVWRRNNDSRVGGSKANYERSSYEL